MKYIDLTHTFTSQMPIFPGDSLPALIKVKEIEKNGSADHQITTGMHVGTHMDAPAHMLVGGKYLHEYAPEKFFGRGVVIDARGKDLADVDLLSNAKIQQGDIVLVYFGFGEKFLEKEYYSKYPEITKVFAEECVKLGVSILGMDTPSPDRAP